MRHEIIPGLRYTDAPAAIEFLCEAFGFERQAVFLDDDDASVVNHAQLLWQDRMIMVSSHHDSEVSRLARFKTIEEAGGPTIGLYLIVDDVDAHANRARAAGAEIFLPPRDQDYGGRGYSARDPEGNIWSFGSYDPWADQ
jgi:uncharacterized glyoxalase superfamily protein PhnB